MRLKSLLSSSLALTSSLVTAVVNSSSPQQLSSKQILPSNFQPPQVFEHVNLVRNVNLDKGYVRETINVVVFKCAPHTGIPEYCFEDMEVVGM